MLPKAVSIIPRMLLVDTANVATQTTTVNDKPPKRCGPTHKRPKLTFNAVPSPSIIAAEMPTIVNNSCKTLRTRADCNSDVPTRLAIPRKRAPNYWLQQGSAACEYTARKGQNCCCRRTNTGTDDDRLPVIDER